MSTLWWHRYERNYLSVDNISLWSYFRDSWISFWAEISGQPLPRHRGKQHLSTEACAAAMIDEEPTMMLNDEANINIWRAYHFRNGTDIEFLVSVSFIERADMRWWHLMPVAAAYQAFCDFAAWHNKPWARHAHHHILQKGDDKWRRKCITR